MVIKNTSWLWISFIILAVITGLSLWPMAQLPDVPGTDKTHHFIAYAVLALPVSIVRPRYWFAVILFYVIYSGGIELTQPYVNRYGEWLDLAANSAGLTIGVVISWLIRYEFGHILHLQTKN